MSVKNYLDETGLVRLVLQIKNLVSLVPRNTAGSVQDTSKLFLVGSKTQDTNAVTYSNDKVYVDGNKLYSNSAEVVNLSDTQALTNKTYNGKILNLGITVDNDGYINISLL